MRRSQTVLSRPDLEALLPWIPGGPVLDAGCGDGQLSRLFYRHGFELVGVDVDAGELAALAAELPGMRTVCADLREAEFGESHWAAIVCNNVLSFLPEADHAPLLRRMRRALKPGGVLIVSAFNAQSPFAGRALARTRSGEPAPLGLVTLRQLRRRFAGWDWWFAFEGVTAVGAPQGVPQGVTQMIVRKPVPELGPVDWQALPSLGAGLGWRSPLREWIAQPGAVDFLEIMTDDFLEPRYDAHLLELTRHFQVIPHGVELSIGTPGGPEAEYLADVARVAARCDSPWWSDHLCYTRTARHQTFALNPLPATEESLELVCANLRRVRQALPRPLLLENAAYYAPLGQSTLSDAEFIGRIAVEADCGILLDVANLYGNARNLGYDPVAYIEALPRERVVQLHLAGGRLESEVLFDTHDRPVWPETWELLREVLRRCDIKAISIERDDHYVDLQTLIAEVGTARRLLGARL